MLRESEGHSEGADDDKMDIVDEADEEVEVDEAGGLVGEGDQVDETPKKHVDCFLLPGRRNFPAIDLIRWPKPNEYIELFQITKSRVHPIKLDQLQELM